ncbi:hypothetical protein ES703_86619 [subsurface metagenome]
MLRLSTLKSILPVFVISIPTVESVLRSTKPASAVPDGSAVIKGRSD